MKEVKTVLWDGIFLYTENPKKSPEKLPELMNDFDKVAVDKVNIQKSVILYTPTMYNPKMKLRKHFHSQ